MKMGWMIIVGHANPTSTIETPAAVATGFWFGDMASQLSSLRIWFSSNAGVVGFAEQITPGTQDVVAGREVHGMLITFTVLKSFEGCCAIFAIDYWDWQKTTHEFWQPHLNT
jgi:hypothetical protein